MDQIGAEESRSGGVGALRASCGVQGLGVKQSGDGGVVAKRVLAAAAT